MSSPLSRTSLSLEWAPFFSLTKGLFPTRLVLTEGRAAAFVRLFSSDLLFPREVFRRSSPPTLFHLQGPLTLLSFFFQGNFFLTSRKGPLMEEEADANHSCAPSTLLAHEQGLPRAMCLLLFPLAAKAFLSKMAPFLFHESLSPRSTDLSRI